jgi:hypothetical protein
MRRAMLTLVTALASAIVLAFVLLALFKNLLDNPRAEVFFGLHGLNAATIEEDGSSAHLAGSHPFASTTDFAVDTVEDPVLKFQVPGEDIRNLTIEVPPGFVADRDATPQCTTAEFRPAGGGEPECARASQVGLAKVELGTPGVFYDAPVFNLTPPPGAVAKLGLTPLGVPVTAELGISPEPPYRGVAKLSNTLQVYSFYSSKVTLWGVPAASAHDADRGGPVDGAKRPFITLPRSCTGPLETRIEATSWQGGFFEEEILSHGDAEEPLGMTGCSGLGFSAGISAQPTNHSAEGPSGLDFSLDVSNPGLTNPTGQANSDLKKARVTLPEGVTINPSQAEGLGVCSETQLSKETADSEPGDGCPQSSKIGTVEVESPLAAGEILKGALYVAEPYKNRFGTLIALYMAIKDPKLGVAVNLAGKVEPDPKTGQLITTFGGEGKDALPQLPFSHFRLHFREGGRSPLITPPLCGDYVTAAELTPWANPTSTFIATSHFHVDSGVGGGPCPPGGTPPFSPGFEAGTMSNDAGSFSPFELRLTRRDGDQDLTKFSATLPPGAAADLNGLSHCSDAQIAQAKRKSGKEELASPSCPATSEIGNVLAGAGVGSQLTYVPGKAYLAGPYNGDPLSVVGIVPAVAGPFDVGTVVTRQALTVNPRSGAAILDGANSDPIPHILAGIPLKVRDVRVHVDRPHFTFNPTNCNPLAIDAQLWGGGANVFSSTDDSPVSRSAPFQAANCAQLGFKPKLAITLKGGTKRGDHPALRATVTPRAGDANFANAVVTLPRSAFLDQAHIRTICTRVQFAAHACPPASVYGFAKATTPILDGPAEGPVYLRSSNHKLPDLVAALKGPPSAEVAIELVGRIDSHKGGIRASFEEIPDLPVSKFVLDMQGGNKGLIVNSRELCPQSSKASAEFSGQNGSQLDFQPVVVAKGCKAHKRARRSRLH